MFGKEVADVAMGYMTALARELVTIDRGVRAGAWPKPSGISLAGRTVALVGYGDIGRNTARRLLAAEMHVVAYDPALDPGSPPEGVETAVWPDRVEEADFIVLTCALTRENRHMLNGAVLARTRRGVRVVNVARGPLIDETALVKALESGQVSAAALDVFEEEPLPAGSPLRRFDRCILGSHNSSNTVDAVRRASERAIDLLFGFLGVS
jgi:D-3-phosphoglycerate dehydrogenase